LGPAIAAADDLIIFSGRSDKFVKPVVKAFEKQTGINVVLHSAESTALLNKLRLEGKRTDADIYLSNDALSNDAGNLEKGAQMGLFQTIPANIADRIPQNYRSNDNQWIGLSARARVLVYNKNEVKPGDIKSVFDLADSKWRNRIGITHSSNESFIAGVTVYMEDAGKQKVKDWLSGLKENAGNNIFNKHSKIVKAVADGKLDVGLVNHYYIFRHLAKHPDAPVGILMPDQDNDMGVAWNVAGAAMPKHAGNKDAAIKFLKFVTSDDGQKLFAEVNREYPTRADVATTKEIPPMKSYKVADVAMAMLGRKRDETIDLLESVGMP
jgi:iron(III) transport system substrate-binding protein